MHSPVFLIGTQRSGTTLLCQMLTAHPDVFIKNELPVRSVFKPEYDRDQIKEKVSYFVEKRYGLGIEALLKKEKKSIWGLKDPELTNYLDCLEKFLPEARFIVITRDPRAVVNSYIRNKWGLGTNAYTGAQRWLQETTVQLEFLKKYPDHVLQIRYEDLVMSQRSTLDKVCRFIGVPLTDAMMQYGSKTSFIKKGRENLKTFEALDPKMTNKWEKELTGRQISIVESICRDTLEKLAYEGKFTPVNVSKMEALYYRSHQAVVGEIQIQYRWRIGAYRHYIKRTFHRIKDKWSQIVGNN